MKFRLIIDSNNSAFMNMGIDESIMHHVGTGKSLPTLRLYSWKPSAVSIGYFQSLEEEVDFDACEKLGVDVVRRITGGGAVFHDKELTYSFIISQSAEIMPKQILDCYKKICRGIIEGLAIIGLKATFVPLNDIVCDGKKISGNAQTRREGCVLQHGTILLDVDVDKMFSILKVPDEKIKDKMIQNVKERVTSLKHILGREVYFDEVCKAMISGFEQGLVIKFSPGKLSPSEEKFAIELAKEKYSTREWNFKR